MAVLWPLLLLGILAVAGLPLVPAQAQLSTGAGKVVLGSYAQRELSIAPLDWTYLRVELPEWFSSANITFVSDADIPSENIRNLPPEEIAVICFMDGNPPIPDISDALLDKLLLNSSLDGFLGDGNKLTLKEHCVPLQKNVSFLFTDKEISPGVWYIGYFNGLGPSRTQSKMISRGRTYVVSTIMTVEGCSFSSIWGPDCNQTISMMPCSTEISNLSRSLFGSSRLQSHQQFTESSKQMDSNSSLSGADLITMTCHDTNGTLCLQGGNRKIYFMDIVNTAVEFTISAADVRLGQGSQANLTDFLMCRVRYNGIPSPVAHDYSSDINKSPLKVRFPQIGRWYVSVEYFVQSENSRVLASSTNAVCFSLGWQVTECFSGKAGINCSWDSYTLQRIPYSHPTVPFDSYYLPADEVAGTSNSHFFLERLISNSSFDQNAWTYFSFDVPRGAASSLIHVRMESDKDLNYELYLKFGSLPSEDLWDYYATSTNFSNSSISFSSKNTTAGILDVYVFYAKEGTWCFGLKHLSNNHDSQTSMLISLEGCHRHCSQKGTCRYSVDESGLTFYSYCDCDRDHGGFDCSTEVVSPLGHLWHSVFLIASNAAAVLPAFWALRRKAYAEWILFTSSGISSALYHACDVGTWCILTFRVLQFLDFWLSFMAVISTFIFMAAIDESYKRAILSAVFILTALLAETGPTRPANIGIVIAIGSLGLLVGWFLEYSTARRFGCFLHRSHLQCSLRLQDIKGLFWRVVDALKKRFRWHFMILGFVALSLAGTSWKLESNNTYWIWHSLWHISIYTSSFFFLCATVVPSQDAPAPPDYDLAQQNSPRTQTGGS